MKIRKWFVIALGAYVGYVLIFETIFLGYLQPTFDRRGIPTLNIITQNSIGKLSKRRLAWFQSSEGHIYVSAHHWTRGWYNELLENPQVQVEIGNTVSPRTAITIHGEEYDKISTEYSIPLIVRLLMGFPPKRDIVRLEPT